MKNLATLCLSFASFYLTISVAVAEQLDIRIISLPAQGVAEVRKVLEDTKLGMDVAAFDTVMKQKGVKSIGSFQHTAVWDDKAVHLAKAIGRIGSNPGKDAEVKVHLAHKVEEGISLQNFNSYLDMPTARDGSEYISFSGDTRYTPVRKGRWHEKGAWTSGREAWMVWQHVTGTDAGDAEAHAATVAALSFTADLVFFKATPSELAQLGKSGPDTREKAVNWLLARGPAWKEMRVSQQVGKDKCFWISHEGKIADTGDGEEVISNRTLSLEITSQRTGGALAIPLDIDMTDGNPGGVDLTENCLLEKVTGRWNFILLENLGGVNVLAYRGIGEGK